MTHVPLNGFPLDLRVAFLLYVAAPLILLVGVAGSVSLGALEEISENRLQEDLELIGRTLQKPMGRAMERGREGALENALESAFSFGRVYGAYLYDANGDQVASAGAAQSYQDRQQEVPERAQEGESGGEYGKVGGRRVYSYFAPLTDTSGQVNGLVQITRRASEIHQYAEELRSYGLAGLVLLALLLGTVIFIGHHYAVGRPLGRLSVSMGRVAEGDYDHRTRVAGPREIAELGRVFNSMVDRIQRDRKEIRERRESQERLQHELRQSEKMASIGRLSAGVAHELGTPLSVVDGSVQRLLRSPDLGTEPREQLERVREQAARMTQIVEQLLAFGRHPAGNPRPVSVERLTRAVTRNTTEALEESHTDLDWRAPEEPLWVEIDPFRGEQILTHLIGNAAQAASGGRIRIDWAPDGRDWVVLTVADDGPGIDPQLRDRIFEPFFTTKPPGQGSGMGLAMVHATVEEHGGRIEVTESTWGGALFRVWLPRSQAASAGEETP